MNNADYLLTLKIDAYIKGQLSDVEQKAFEQDLKADAALVERVRLQRAELVVLEQIAEADLRLKVRKWSAQMDDGDAHPPRQWWRHPLSILAFLGCTTALFFLLLPKKTTTDTVEQDALKAKQDTTQSTPTSKDLPELDTLKKMELPIQNAKPTTQNPQPKTPNPPIAVVKNKAVEDDLLAYVEAIERASERSDAPTSPLSKAVQLIQNQNFTSARSALSGINPQAVNYADAQFLLATIDYLQNKPKAAVATFKTLSEMDGYIRKEQAIYYWATSLLADGQTTEAKKILTQIATDTEHPKHNAAIVLLKSL